MAGFVYLDGLRCEDRDDDYMTSAPNLGEGGLTRTESYPYLSLEDAMTN